MTLQTTTIVSDGVEDGEQTLQTLEKAEQLAAANAPEDERPDWLPEEFSTVEEFRAAYDQLKSGAQSEEDPEDPEDDNEESEETSEDEVREAVENAGVDFDALTQEYLEAGTLSEETFEALEKGGIPRNIVEAHIAGLEAQATLTRMKAAETVGGEENLQTLLSWAGESLSEKEINHINSLVESNDFDGYLIALQGIQRRYEAQYGSFQNPTLAGSTQAVATDVYESFEQVKAEMRDPRYKVDEAYRRKVEAKLARSRRAGTL